MADEADKSDEKISIAVDAKIDELRRAIPKPPRKGQKCLNYGCDEKAQPGGRFCCKECATDYDYRVKRLRAQGVSV